MEAFDSEDEQITGSSPHKSLLQQEGVHCAGAEEEEPPPERRLLQMEALDSEDKHIEGSLPRTSLLQREGVHRAVAEEEELLPERRLLQMEACDPDDEHIEDSSPQKRLQQEGVHCAGADEEEESPGQKRMLHMKQLNFKDEKKAGHTYLVQEFVTIDALVFLRIFNRLEQNGNTNSNGEVHIALVKRVLNDICQLFELRSRDSVLSIMADQDRDGDGWITWIDFLRTYVHNHRYFEMHLTMPERLYLILEEPGSCPMAQHVMMLVLLAIITSTTASLLQTMDWSESRLNVVMPNTLSIVEVVCVILFTAEYVLKMISSPWMRHEFLDTELLLRITVPEGMGSSTANTEAGILSIRDHGFVKKAKRLMYFLLKPANMVDFLSVAPWWVETCIGGEVANLNFLRALKTTKFLRLLKVGKYNYTLSALGLTLYRSIPSISVLLLYITLTSLCVGGILYEAERGTWDEDVGDVGAYVRKEDGLPTTFTSIPQSIRWTFSRMLGVEFYNGVDVGVVMTPAGCIIMSMLGVYKGIIWILPFGQIAAIFNQTWKEIQSAKETEQQLEMRLKAKDHDGAGCRGQARRGLEAIVRICVYDESADEQRGGKGLRRRKRDLVASIAEGAVGSHAVLKMDKAANFIGTTQVGSMAASATDAFAVGLTTAAFTAAARVGVTSGEDYSGPDNKGLVGLGQFSAPIFTTQSMRSTEFVELQGGAVAGSKFTLPALLKKACGKRRRSVFFNDGDGDPVAHIRSGPHVELTVEWEPDHYRMADGLAHHGERSHAMMPVGQMTITLVRAGHLPFGHHFPYCTVEVPLELYPDRGSVGDEIWTTAAHQDIGNPDQEETCTFAIDWRSLTERHHTDDQDVKELEAPDVDVAEPKLMEPSFDDDFKTGCSLIAHDPSTQSEVGRRLGVLESRVLALDTHIDLRIGTLDKNIQVLTQTMLSIAGQLSLKPPIEVPVPSEPCPALLCIRPGRGEENVGEDFDASLRRPNPPKRPLMQACGGGVSVATKKQV